MSSIFRNSDRERQPVVELEIGTLLNRDSMEGLGIHGEIE